MTDIIWLASYPKSGNTWLRFILANLLYESIQSSADVKTAIPDIYELLSSDLELLSILLRNKVIIKTHLLLQENHPLLDLTQKAIYIVRHPIDVMFSSYNYLKLINGGLPILTLEEYINLFLTVGGDAFFQSKGIGIWQENVTSWLNANFPVLLLKYEDMLSYPLEQMQKIVTFLDLDFSEDTIRDALDKCNFEKLKSLEKKEIENQEQGLFAQANFMKACQQGVHFFNHGNIHAKDEWLYEQGQKVFNPLLDILGY